MPIPHYFNYCSSKSSILSRPNCPPFSKVLAFPYKFFNKHVNFYQKAQRNFDWDYFKSIDHFGENYNLNNIEFSNS